MISKTENQCGAAGRVVVTLARSRHGAAFKQSDVARDTGLSESTVSRIIRADRITLRAALALRDAYGIADLAMLDPDYRFKGRRLCR